MTNLELEHLLSFEPVVGPCKQSSIRDFLFSYAILKGFTAFEAETFVELYSDALLVRFGRKN